MLTAMNCLSSVAPVLARHDWMGRMRKHELLEMILDAFAELATLHAAAATTAERARSALVAEHDDADLRQTSCAR